MGAQRQQTIPEAAAARKEGIQMFVVGVTSLIDEQTLKDMSSLPQEKDKNYFTSPDFNQLDTILDNLIGQACVTQTARPPVTPSLPRKFITLIINVK